MAFSSPHKNYEGRPRTPRPLYEIIARLKERTGGVFVSIYRVVKSREVDSENPIIVYAGEQVTCIEESDPQGDWGGWILCESANNKGWIPTQIIDRCGKEGTITEDYNAIEFNIEVGEILISTRKLNGWIWGYKKDKPNYEAWAPLNHVEVIEE